MTVENGVLKKASFSTGSSQREALMVEEKFWWTNGVGEIFAPDEMVENLKRGDWSSDFLQVIEYALKNCTYGDLKKVSWLIVKVWFYWTLREEDPCLRGEYLSAMETLSDAFNPDKGME